MFSQNAAKFFRALAKRSVIINAGCVLHPSEFEMLKFLQYFYRHCGRMLSIAGTKVGIDSTNFSKVSNVSVERTCILYLVLSQPKVLHTVN